MAINIDSNPTLYALNKDGSFQEWKVYTEGSEVIVEFGKLGGKVQQKRTTCDPKNVGRANETDAAFQALLEAKSKWEKQVRLGYRETVEELQTEDQFSPMLAHDALKRKSSIVYPVFVQPKLDGVRCLVTFDENGDPVFNSRGNKTYPVQGQIVSQMKRLREATGVDMFDGEVYLHGLSLQKILSLVKKWRTEEDVSLEIQKETKKLQKTNPEAVAEHPYGGYSSKDLEFHIFDIPSNKPWIINDGISDFRDTECRYADLIAVGDTNNSLALSRVQVVNGATVNDEEEVLLTVAVNMQNGYEGSMIRNFKGLYEFGQRSSDLQKWKVFKTDEAIVEGVEVDKNGQGVLKCRRKNGIRFKCKMKGTHAETSYDTMLKIVGKFITFSYQTDTDDGVPQFPVGVCTRDVDLITWEVQE